LSILQNKAVKSICGGHCHDHLSPFYSELKILKLFDLHKLEIVKTVYKHSQNNLPPPLSRLFKKTGKISLRHTNTRTSNPINKYTLYNPRFCAARLQKCIKY